MLKKGQPADGSAFSPEAGYDIFIRQGNVLNTLIEKAEGKDIPSRQKQLAERYYDIRTFGAVLATGDKGAGTIRGPVQFTFSRSRDRIFQAEHSITRCAVTTEKEREAQEKREFASTFGRKATIPYALYRMHGFISVIDAWKTGFSEEDLELLWESLLNAFEHDRSAARGEMNPRKLIIFKHDGYLGNARSGQLFDLVKIDKLADLPRNWVDYKILPIEQSSLPHRVSLIEKL
jgi:CRISPR-associated protein Csd2